MDGLDERGHPTVTLPTERTSVGAGRYLLGPVLGIGGMARVVRASDTVLGRQVAVKLFRDDLDHDDAARARQEMQTLAGLTHPGLVSVHDAGTERTDDGSERSWLVMELIDGPTLAGVVLDPDRAAVVGRQVALALAHVHAAGIVHRDVKPANILLAPDGSARLTDFGIARIIDGARHTGTGLTIGTAPYLSPEQVTGGPVGPPADVYALGLVLLESLTGHREYDGGPVETAMARLHRQPAVSGGLPAPWPELLTAMTARQPADRPTAADVARVLGEGGAVAATAVTALPPTRVTPTLPSPSTGAALPPTTTNRRGPEPTRVVPLVSGPVGAPRRRTTVLAVAGLVALVALVAAALAASGSGAGTQGPAPSPSGSVTGPAGTARLEQDLRDLRSAVTP